MMIQGLLPVGSVVMLKEGNHRLMVLGYCQQLQDEQDKKVYDYVGCLWPEGYMSADKNIVFNHDSVDTVYFLGYQTDGQMVFSARIEAALKEYRSR